LIEEYLEIKCEQMQFVSKNETASSTAFRREEETSAYCMITVSQSKYLFTLFVCFDK
jgi:hypothetical protein